MSITLTNAQLVTEDGIVSGTLTYDESGILDVQPGNSAVRGAEDAEGDLVVPGLIECHTDNLERHVVPRPGVIWPNSLAAAMAHDAQIIASGITTVYDAMCVGGYDDEKDYRPKILGSMLAAVEEGNAHQLFRAEHRIHLRCETTDARMMSYLERHSATGSASLASLMDHTPAAMAECRSLSQIHCGRGPYGRRDRRDHRVRYGARQADRAGQFQQGGSLLQTARHSDREP